MSVASWIIGLIIFAFIIFILLNLVDLAHGQDVDPRYYCLIHQYPFNELCQKQKIHEIYNDLLERAKEFNKMK